MATNGRPRRFVPHLTLWLSRRIPTTFKNGSKPESEGEISLFYCRALVPLRPGGQSASALRPAGDICEAENANTPWMT